MLQPPAALSHPNVMERAGEGFGDIEGETLAAGDI